MRKVPSWIDGFLEHTQHKGSPRLFRLWAALATVAGALERKVYIRTAKGTLYPNIYAFLVGPAGVGKTVMTSEAEHFMSCLKDHHMASSNLSKASLVDDLKDADRRIVQPDKIPAILSFNALTVISDELGVFLPSYETEFMNALTHLWDGRPYSERKRTKDLQFRIDRPIMTILAGTTPQHLTSLLPEGAFEMGFMSRTILVYSGETIIQDLFKYEEESKVREPLEADIKRIAELSGRMTFSEEAAEAISAWHMSGGDPKPDHPKLLTYTIRRTAHLLKLCMLVSAAESDELEITLEHFQKALDILVETEYFMPDIFKAMNTGGDSRAIEETYYHAYQIYVKEKKPIQEHRLIAFIQQRVPAHSVMRVLEVMEASKLLRASVEPKIGKCYVPLGRVGG